MQRLENRIPPTLSAILTGAAMWVATGEPGTIPIPLPVRTLLTGSLALVAVALEGLAILAFRRARTSFNPVRIGSASRVVTTGIFRHTRNPMYLGLVVALGAWAVWLSSPWALIGPALFAGFTHRFQILPEERVLTALFGRDFEDYQRRVRRWL
ncbi:MAG: hypothetical protein RIS76_760 [Verrucomicrobiota bacterium]|jgi:protein-S-isoprenylcysteine O-methyltransferase Ste14